MPLYAKEAEESLKARTGLPDVIDYRPPQRKKLSADCRFNSVEEAAKAWWLAFHPSSEQKASQS